ncbi:hypothetical protein EV132_110177 [Rhizobium sullae]|uniref:Uncharacterized protein n=1 Tax=Rhizobium sullae TaxID=50338 RepID=A0A4R3PZI2_RHISU|nr:hypothetical protein EV132_110177 [Rhizobium sullae]
MWQWGRLVARIVGDEGDAGAGVREQHRLARIDYGSAWTFSVA